MSQDYKAWARFYASLGWHVFPLVPGTKRPLPRHGSSEATADLGQIETWWTQSPTSGIGMSPRPSGLYVLDVDPRNDGIAGLAELEKKHGAVETPVIVFSGRGEGFHNYFRADPASKYLGQPGKGLDGKHAGYVVLPPSLHPDSGQPYTWGVDAETLHSINIPVAPSFLLKPEPTRVREASRAGSHDDLPQIKAALEHISPEHYEDWWQTMASLHHWGHHADLIDLAYDTAREWSAQSSKHDDGTFDWKWETFDSDKKDARGIGSMIMQARKNGYLPGPDPALCFPAALAAAAAFQGATAEEVLAQGAPLPAVQGDIDFSGLPVESDQYQGRWFAQKFRNLYKHSPGLGWLANQGDHWLADEGSAARLTVGDQLKGMLPAIQPSKQAAILGSGRLNSILDVARDFPQVRVLPEQWDAEPFILNTPGEAYDLKTGKPVDRNQHLLTQRTSVAPDFNMPTPVWDRVLRDMCPEHEFLTRVLGYGLMADLSEEMIFILYGDGQNGKSKILECVKEILGDYSTTYSSKALVRNNRDDSKEDAKLRGKRFALCEEIPLGARWDDDKIKNATSSSTLTVKLMRENAFEMPSRFRVFLATNYLPALDGLDFAMRRRLCLIHFPRTVTEAEKDRKLPEKLEAEAPGILAKLILAAQAWHRDGLVLPESVKASVGEYMDDNDEIQAWLDSECAKDDAAVTVTHDLYRSYACYVEATTRAPMSPQGFGMALKKKGFAKSKETTGKKRRVILGLKLNPS